MEVSAHLALYGDCVHRCVRTPFPHLLEWKVPRHGSQHWAQSLALAGVPKVFREHVILTVGNSEGTGVIDMRGRTQYKLGVFPNVAILRRRALGPVEEPGELRGGRRVHTSQIHIHTGERWLSR